MSMRYATAILTGTMTQEVTYHVRGDFPDGFALWSKGDKYAWLDENAVDQIVEYYESDSIQSIDNVFFDE